MAKEAGLGMTMGVDDSGGSARAIANDLTAVNWDQQSNVMDITGIDKSAMERLLLLADFQITLNAVFNDAATTTMFAVFKNYRTSTAGSGTGRTTTMVHSGQTLANEVIYSALSMTRGSDGSFTANIPGSLTGGVVPVWS
jgi:hypothetical protein